MRFEKYVNVKIKDRKKRGLFVYQALGVRALFPFEKLFTGGKKITVGTTHLLLS